MKSMSTALLSTIVAVMVLLPVQAASEVAALGAYPYGPDRFIIEKAAMGDRLPTGQFGMMWDEPVYVNSMTVTFHNEGGGSRGVPSQILIYTSPDGPGVPYTLTKTSAESGPYGTYSVNITTPIEASNSYLMAVVCKADRLPGTGDGWIGLVKDAGYTFGVTSMNLPQGDNLNENGSVSLKKFTVAATGSGAVYEGTAVTKLGDSKIASAGAGNTADGIYWQCPAAGDSRVVTLTAEYNSAYVVGSIGLGFAGEMYNGTGRALPESITVTGYASDGQGGFVKVAEKTVATLASDWNSALYGRYALGDGFVNIVKLDVELVLPAGNTGNYVGVTEFQAFAKIPEPATMTLLALGGLALLRRRSGR